MDSQRAHQAAKYLFPFVVVVVETRILVFRGQFDFFGGLDRNGTH